VGACVGSHDDAGERGREVVVNVSRIEVVSAVS
jgi:hypothetical protein